MKHLVAVSAMALLLVMAAPTFIAAHDGGHDGGHDGDHRGGGEDRTRVEIRTNQAGRVREANEAAEVEDEAAEVAEAPVVAGTATFEIRGQVTAMSGNTFTVAGLSVTSDPTMVTRFEQKGTLAVGSMVKVEGIVRSGTLFAEEIKVQ